MRAAAAIVMLLSAAGTAGAQSPLAAEIRALADRYHERPARIDTIRPLVTQAAQADQAVLDEKAPSNPADWTLKDSPEARRLLDALPGRS